MLTPVYPPSGVVAAVPSGASTQIDRKEQSLCPHILMKAKIDTPEGRAIYGRRLANVEPVFANIRAQKQMDRFTLRGRQKVNVQWTLFCLVHNIEKILNYGESNAKAS